MQLGHDDSFTELMQSEGVTRIQPARHSGAAVPAARSLRADPSKSIRRRLAQGSPEGLSLEHLELLHPADPISWKREGVQEGVFRNLRLGRYNSDANLNLQHFDPSQARDELVGFIRQSHELGIRTVTVQIGRARGAEDPANRLKSYLDQWLKQLDLVLAYHSGQPQHGGLAAVYLMLRKNAQNRQQNWEQHQKRR